MSLKRTICATICLLVAPCRSKNVLLRRSSRKVMPSAKIHLSWVSSRHLRLGAKARTRSVRFGDCSILSGRTSQAWAHGNLHDPAGIGRFGDDGDVMIGNNVDVGTGSFVDAAVKIGDAIAVCSGATVSISPHIAGHYVSQPLRMVELDYTTARQPHPQIRVPGLVETVVYKRSANGS